MGSVYECACHSNANGGNGSEAQCTVNSTAVSNTTGSYTSRVSCNCSISCDNRVCQSIEASHINSTIPLDTCARITCRFPNSSINTTPGTCSCEECASNTCQNRGTCYLGVNNSDICLCPEGLTGQHCGCITKTKNSTCICSHHKDSTYDCTCQSNTTDGSVAGRILCRPNSTNSLICTCSDGCIDNDMSCIHDEVLTTAPNISLDKCASFNCTYSTGDNTTTAICSCEKCNNQTCQNGGTCYQVLNNSYTCLCPEGLTGKHCGCITKTANSTCDCSHHMGSTYNCTCQSNTADGSVVSQIQCMPNSTNGLICTCSNGCIDNDKSCMHDVVLTTAPNISLDKCASFNCTYSTGDNTTTAICSCEECKNQTCQNGGTCYQVLNNSYTCLCPEGLTGKHCGCITKTPNSTCICSHHMNGTYNCTCRSNTTDGSVESPIQCVADSTNGLNCACSDDCVDNDMPCQHVEVLAPAPNISLAKCASFNCTYSTGDDTTTAICSCEKCDNQTCLNGGTCYQVLNNSYTCSCPEGLTGKHCGCITKTANSTCDCSHQMDSTYNCTCQSNTTDGSVVSQIQCMPNSTNGLNCTCSDDCIDDDMSCQRVAVLRTFSNITLDKCAGFNCTFMTLSKATITAGACSCKECTSNTCQNAGTCYFGVNNTDTCVCPAGFTGYHCESNKDECASNPCPRNGSCTDSLNSYTCSCVEGYVYETPYCLKRKSQGTADLKTF